MIIVGAEGCSECFAVEARLRKKGIPYRWIDLYNIPTEEQNKYMKIADEAGKMSLPLILKDGELIDESELFTKGG